MVIAWRRHSNQSVAGENFPKESAYRPLGAVGMLSLAVVKPRANKLGEIKAKDNGSINFKLP